MEGGQSLESLFTKKYKLKGLNKGWKAGCFNNIYATVEYGKEDWFHCSFDENLFNSDRLMALFNMFKNSEDNLWKCKHMVIVKCTGYSSAGTPINPIIKELILDI